jgi:hypothetical protein
MRAAFPFVMVGLVGLALAACGGSSHPSASSSSDPGLKFAVCMRAHGVTNFPDPGGSGQFNFSLGSGINPASPTFQHAQKACGGGPGGPPQIHMTERQKLSALHFAQCVRTHGVPGFPDPAYSAPSNGGPILALRGMFFAPSPGFNPMSPAFRQAAKDCGLGLPAMSKSPS